VGGKVGGKVGYTWHTEKTFGAVRYGKVKSKQSNTYIYGKGSLCPGVSTYLQRCGLLTHIYSYLSVCL